MLGVDDWGGYQQVIRVTLSDAANWEVIEGISLTGRIVGKIKPAKVGPYFHYIAYDLSSGVSHLYRTPGAGELIFASAFEG